MSKLIVEMEMPQRCFDCPMHDWTYGLHGTRQNMLVCNAHHELTPILCQTILNGDERPDWCPIKGVLPDGHGDLIDRHKTAEELNEMADEVYNDFPLVDRETLASWDHGIRMAAQYVQNLAGRKDAAERKDDELSC